MAIEVKGFQFLLDENAPDFVVPQTFDVPTAREVKGVVAGQSGPLLLIEGDWSTTLESCTYTFIRRNELPWTVGTDTCVALVSDTVWSFFGLVAETINP